MQAIFDIFTQIGDFFTTLFDIVVKLVSDIIYIVELLANLVPNLSVFLGWLPSTCIAILVSTFAVVVIYKVLGRD